MLRLSYLLQLQHMHSHAEDGREPAPQLVGMQLGCISVHVFSPKSMLQGVVHGSNLVYHHAAVHWHYFLVYTQLQSLVCSGRLTGAIMPGTSQTPQASSWCVTIWQLNRKQSSVEC